MKGIFNLLFVIFLAIILLAIILVFITGNAGFIENLASTILGRFSLVAT